jgi:hypothetical protein
MRRFLVVLGAVVLLFIVAAGAGVGVLIYKGTALDRDSRAYVDRAVPAIVANWSKRELLDRATPELRASARPEDLEAVFDLGSRLGPFVEYEGATGDSNISVTTGNGGVVAARYTAQVRFRDGTATIHILLLKRDGTWMINGFHIDPHLGPGAAQGT